MDWNYIDFQDNQPCINLIEGHPQGILSALDSFHMGGDKVCCAVYEHIRVTVHF